MFNGLKKKKAFIHFNSYLLKVSDSDGSGQADSALGQDDETAPRDLWDRSSCFLFHRSGRV